MKKRIGFLFPIQTPFLPIALHEWFFIDQSTYIWSSATQKINQIVRRSFLTPTYQSLSVKTTLRHGSFRYQFRAEQSISIWFGFCFDPNQNKGFGLIRNKRKRKQEFKSKSKLWIQHGRRKEGSYVPAHYWLQANEYSKARLQPECNGDILEVEDIKLAVLHSNDINIWWRPHIFFSMSSFFTRDVIHISSIKYFKFSPYIRILTCSEMIRSNIHFLP